MKEHRINCAQTVITTFCEELGLDRAIALQVANGFGGGMGRTGRTCGAVTGAYMVLGLSQDIPAEKPRASGNKTAVLMRRFNKRFVKKYGSMECKELLGCDLSTQEVRAEARAKELSATLYPVFVGTSVKILESLLKSNK